MKVCELTEHRSGKSTWLLNEFINGDFKRGIIFSIHRLMEDDLLRKFMEIYQGDISVNKSLSLIRFKGRELYLQVLTHDYQRFLGINYDFIGFDDYFTYRDAREDLLYELSNFYGTDKIWMVK